MLFCQKNQYLVKKSVYVVKKINKMVKKRRLQNHARNDRGEILSIFHTGRHGIRQILENPIFGSNPCQNLKDLRP